MCVCRNKSFYFQRTIAFHIKASISSVCCHEFTVWLLCKICLHTCSHWNEKWLQKCSLCKKQLKHFYCRSLVICFPTVTADMFLLVVSLILVQISCHSCLRSKAELLSACCGGGGWSLFCVEWEAEVCMVLSGLFWRDQWEWKTGKIVVVAKAAAPEVEHKCVSVCS